MEHADAFRRCLINLDIVEMRELWAIKLPHLPQLEDNEEVLITMHHARTGTSSIPVRLREWSHDWLRERGLPSALPARLKSKMFPGLRARGLIK